MVYRRPTGWTGWFGMQHRFEDEMRDILERIRDDLDQGITRQIGESGGGPSQPVQRVVGLNLLRNGHFNHSYQSWYPKPPLPRDGNYECAWWYSHSIAANTPMSSVRTGNVSFRTIGFEVFGPDVTFWVPWIRPVTKNFVVTVPEAILTVTPAP